MSDQREIFFDEQATIFIHALFKRGFTKNQIMKLSVEEISTTLSGYFSTIVDKKTFNAILASVFAKLKEE